MRECRMVMYAFCVVVRVLVLLFLFSLVKFLAPWPDPFTQAGLLLLVFGAVFSFRPVRRRVLRWVAGTPPMTEVETTVRPE